MTSPEHQPDEFDQILLPLRIMLGVLVAMVVGGLIAGFFFIGSLQANDRDIQKALDDIVATRTEGRATTCDSDKKFELNHNRLVQADQDNITQIIRDYARSDGARKEINEQYAAQRVAAYEITKVPVRRCDTKSINLFYESGGTLGCETTSANPKGECR